MEIPILDELVSNGLIFSYELVNVDENGNETNLSNQKGFRNTQKLKIVFNNGPTLVVETFCSGSSENTTLHFSKEE